MLSLLLALVFSAWSQVSLAADAGRIVGTVTIEIDNRAASRTITNELWFEAAPGAAIERFSTRPLFRAIPIARNATPNSAGGKRPLIVISHGNFGSRFSHGWLAVPLVTARYVVLSTSHPGTTAGDQSAAGRYRLWDRSRDVSFAIDELLKNARWSWLIDERRIGFVGHSFGGWTGVSLAGGRWDPARQRAFCERAQQRDLYCAGTLRDEVAGVPARDGGESYKDTRITAFYIMAAGPGQGFTPESLKSISVPFIVETAQFDTVLEPQANSSVLARQIPGAREVIRPAGHFVYAPECIGEIPAGVSQICSDPPGVERGLVHERVAREVIEFFNHTFSR